MACTIDHLRTDHRVRVIQEFSDARGFNARVGMEGILRRTGCDWSRNEIWIAWERNGHVERLYFAIKSDSGPRNGKMREYFELGDFVAAVDPAPVGIDVAKSCQTENDFSDSEHGSSGFGIDQSFSERSLGERTVACQCDSRFFRAIRSGTELGVHACLRCGTVTCTRSVGDDGRFTGDSWQAYLTVPVSPVVVDWISLWPRVKIDYGSTPDRWPMSGALVRYSRLFYPAETRCDDLSELGRLESELRLRSTGKSIGTQLRRLLGNLPPPPPGIPTGFEDFVECWEALQFGMKSEWKRLIPLARLGGGACEMAIDLLLDRSDRFEIMVQAMESSDAIWQSAGLALAREIKADPGRLGGLLISCIDRLPVSSSAVVQERVTNCQRFEALLVVIADQKIATREMLETLCRLRSRLRGLDEYLVDHIRVVERELTSDGTKGANAQPNGRV